MQQHQYALTTPMTTMTTSMVREWQCRKHYGGDTERRKEIKAEWARWSEEGYGASPNQKQKISHRLWILNFHDNFPKNHCHFTISMTFSQKSSLKCYLYLEKCHHFKSNINFRRTDVELALLKVISLLMTRNDWIKEAFITCDLYLKKNPTIMISHKAKQLIVNISHAYFTCKEQVVTIMILLCMVYGMQFLGPSSHFLCMRKDILNIK